MINKLINCVNNNEIFNKNELETVIFDYCNDKCTDEQILPFIKTIYEKGLNDKNLFLLTNAMLNSGEIINLTDLGDVVDKHSTGGVSDTTTLIIAPICASLNVKMLKLSGKALGFTGGTIDKLECFENLKTDIDIEKAKQLVKINNACVISANKNLAPADKKIYALRHKYNLVDSIPLIASSIMSKKLASGSNLIVLDVKYGNGAFMKTKSDAKKLAKKMKAIGKFAGKKIKISYGNMNEPLGNNIGSKLEVLEAIDVLNNKKNNSKLYKYSVHLASLCVSLYKKIPYFISKIMVKNVIKNGKALNKFKQIISSQNGKLNLFDEKLEKCDKEIKSDITGKITFINTELIGKISNELYALTSDNSVGMIVNFRLNKKINKDETLFYMYCKDEKILKKYEKTLKNCVKIQKK